MNISSPKTTSSATPAIVMIVVVVLLSGLMSRVYAGGTGGVKVADMTLSESSHTLTTGDTYSIVPIFTPGNVTDNSFTMVSSDPGVATVPAVGIGSGLVTTVAAGVTTITITSRDLTNGAFTATDVITVVDPRTVYWWNGGADAQWATLANNWWNDAGHTSATLVMPESRDYVITEGALGTGPHVDLDSWTAPASLDASATGITFTSASSVGLNLSITGPAYFEGSSQNRVTVTGDATFRGDASENSGSVSGSMIREYVTDIKSGRNFTMDGQWHVLANGAKVDVTTATIDTDPLSPTHTIFSVTNGGCFIGGPTPDCSSLAVPAAQATAPIINSMPGGSVANQVQNLRAMGNSQLAGELIKQYPALFLGGTSSGATDPFSRDLTIGSTGDDVRRLQVILNKSGFVVSVAGNGSLGHESSYFGIKTQAALGMFQAAKGIAPTRGYFGLKTRNYLSAH